MLPAPAGALYCILEPDDLLSERSRFLDTLGGALSEYLTREPEPHGLHLSAAYFRTDYAAKWLCGIGFEPEVPLTVYVQKAQGSRIHIDQVFTQTLETCFDTVRVVEVGCDVWDTVTGPNCPNNQTNTHHVKAIWVQGASRDFHVFGSGNFSPQSLVANIEDWVAIETEVASDLVCVWPFLDALAAEPGLRYNEQRAIWDDCIAASNAVSGVEIIMLPFDRNDFKDKLQELFAISTSVELVAEVLESQFLIDLIKNATHTRITLFLDDAYHYTAIDPAGASFGHVDPANAKEIAALGELAHIELRYLQTNHHPATLAHNSVHARSILFETPKGLSSMVGSSHFKDGSWRLNTEQQVFLSARYSQPHVEFFSELRKRSVLASKLPAQNTRAH